jgi:hypothetical protein
VPGTRAWLPLGFAITFIFVFIYMTAQQNLRMNANDPQVTIANDIAMALGEGVPYSEFSSPHPVDMAASLSPYVILYDLSGKPIIGSAALDHSYPTPPRGVFEYAKKHGEDRVTWQPKKGVRQAIVVRYHLGTNPAYVVAGRSLTEVESREAWLFNGTEVLWAFTMLGSLFFSVFVLAFSV